VYATRDGPVTWLDVPIIAVFAAYFLAVPRRVGLLRVDCLFVYVQLLMALGALPLLDPNIAADDFHGKVLAYTLIAFMVTNWLLHSLRKPEATRTGEVRTFVPTFNMWLWVGLCVLITVAYFTAVGYSAFLTGLTSAASGGTADVATLRLNSYSGQEYYYPGYVNQFKNSLLPAMLIVILTYWRVAKKPRLTMTLVLFAFTAFGLLGTGQRGAFVLALVLVVVYLYLYDRKRFPRRAAMVGSVSIPLLLLATFALGRGGNYAGEPSLIGKAQIAVTQFIGRLSGSNQLSSVAGFRYIYDKPTQNGAEWWTALTGVLPGVKGSDLSNQIFATLYGSTRGTAPPSLWGAIYYNFGTVGIAVAPMLLAALLFWLGNKGMKPETRNTLELVGIAGVFTVVGTWAAGDPTAMLNTGLVVYILVWRWGRRTRNRVLETAPPEGSPDLKTSPSGLGTYGRGRTGSRGAPRELAPTTKRRSP
jgi:oligosaccharide repeat unit polymerase